MLGFLAVTVKGGISLRNGMWHGLRNDIIMRNVNFQHVLETEIIANEPSGRRRSDTGSRGDVFVVRTSKPVENLGYFDRVTVSLHVL